MKSKIFILTISCLALIIVLFSCKKKNTVTDNNPPNTPLAPQVFVDTSEIGEKVTFTITVFDPDEDSVAARFNWGDGDTSGWCDFLPSGDTVIGKHCYRSIGTFYVKARAKDNHEETSDWSEPDSIVIQDSAWTLVWTCATSSAGWSRRMGHTSIVFDNNIWVLGGGNWSGSGIYNDVWYSDDGINWTCATEAAQWSGRSGHTSVVFNDKIWVLGGHTGTGMGYRNDVWFSSDGIEWTCAIGSAPWTPRHGHTSVVFDDKIWVIGGGEDVNGRPFGDIWYSNDGSNWTCATPMAECSTKSCHSSLVFDNKIWILGGENEGCSSNDIWYSTNGATWKKMVKHDTLIWSGRFGHTTAVLEDKIWVLGGCADDGGGNVPSNDIWYSDKGEFWNRDSSSTPWCRREYHTSVIFQNRIWVLSGYNAPNDVWYGEIVHGE